MRGAASWVLAGGLLAAPAAQALELLVDYRLRDGEAAGIRICSLYAVKPDAGAGNILITGGAGLGVVGGANDALIDGGEAALFLLDGSSSRVVYSVGAASNPDGDALVGEGFLEAFAPGGGSLGVQPVSGTGVVDVSARFAGATIEGFEITAVEGVRIAWAEYRPAPGDEIVVFLSGAGLVPIEAPAFHTCGLGFAAGSGNVGVTAAGVADAAGASANRIDLGETLEVAIDEPVRGITYDVHGDAGYEHFVEAFSASGASLGIRSPDGPDTDLADPAYFGGAAISRFVLTAIDPIVLREVTFVPEPAAGAAAAVLGLALLRRRA